MFLLVKYLDFNTGQFFENWNILQQTEIVVELLSALELTTICLEENTEPVCYHLNPNWWRFLFRLSFQQKHFFQIIFFSSLFAQNIKLDGRSIFATRSYKDRSFSSKIICSRSAENDPTYCCFTFLKVSLVASRGFLFFYFEVRNLSK